mgnify:CR=1 FL=1
MQQKNITGYGKEYEILYKYQRRIKKNRDMKTDAQVINFFRAVQHGKNLVKDVTPEMSLSMDTKTADKIKRINLLFDMMKDAQEKAFGGIIDKKF